MTSHVICISLIIRKFFVQCDSCLSTINRLLSLIKSPKIGEIGIYIVFNVDSSHKHNEKRKKKKRYSRTMIGLLPTKMIVIIYLCIYITCRFHSLSLLLFCSFFFTNFSLTCLNCSLFFCLGEISVRLNISNVMDIFRKLCISCNSYDNREIYLSKKLAGEEIYC